jgi:anaerobic selenocysteine-containing dehydrogenase
MGAGQKVAKVGESWSDLRIILKLAEKMELGEYFWNDAESFFDVILKPIGLTFEEFRKIAIIPSSKRYRGFEVSGFETPSGKVELYSSQLKKWGLDPLPRYHELPETPFSAPELAKEYPLIFTSWKPVQYRHSAGRQITTLRGGHPEPVVNIHPQTAEDIGVNDGDWAFIETKRGRIKQKVVITDKLDPRVVIADYSWWFPEKGISDLYGWAESNLNVLTDNGPPYNAELGTVNLRGILCKVYRAS